MPLFPRLDVRNLWKPQTISELDAEMDLSLGGQPSLAGVNVSEQTALNYLAYYSCVRVRAETMGMISLHLYQREGEGARRATEHPLYEMLHDAPNEETVSSQWRETMSSHYDTWGNNYSWIDRETRGRYAGNIRQLYQLKPDRDHMRRVYRDPETNRLKYEYFRRKADGTEDKRIYDASEILHIPGLAYDGVVGYSPVSIARQGIGLGLALEEFGARFFGQGTHAGALITYPQTITEEQIKPRIEALKNQYAGLQKSHGLMVLSSGGEYKPISMPLEDAQFLATRRFQQGEIAGLLRVPLHLIQNLERATFSNIEQQLLEFIMLTMTPPCHKWEQYLNLKLLTREERRQGYYFKFDLNSIMRGDSKTRAEFYEKMRIVGGMNANEIRVKEEMNPREDPGGEEYWDQGPSGQGQQPKSSAEARLRPVRDEALGRISRREQQDVLREAARCAKKGDSAAWSAWLDSFCADHTAFCERVLAPYYEALGSPNEAAIEAQSRVNALRDALSDVQLGDNESIRAALEGIPA